MNKILVILLSVSVMMACNSVRDNENNLKEPSNETHRDHEGNAPGLVLNNGAKWKADSTTLINVSLLHAIVVDGKQEKPENFPQTAERLQDGLNKLVKECKMTGADHDALHAWLEPLLEKTKDLGKASSPENAATILNEIDKHIGLFAQYFK